MPALRPDRAAEILSRSGLFDPDFYAAAAGPFDSPEQALRHYLSTRAVPEPAPHPAFDPAAYRAAAEARGERVGNALLHYLLVGSKQGIPPSRSFDPAAYRRSNPDIIVAGYEPFGHALRFAGPEGRRPEIASAPPDIPASPWPAAAATPEVDVVMPVHRSLDDATRALATLLAARTRTPFEIVVVDDASPEPDLSAALDAMAAAGRITLLRNERNRGFVASANRGMGLHPERDVVLLNADTAVFDYWLDRLLARLRRPRIGTVTPLSNAATIFSYPIRLRDNPGKLEISYAALDRLCADTPAARIDVPTGVGFCMAIARACLDEVGAFDEANFGRGYGEENDFCRRAAVKGWANVAANDVFVWHRGGGAFGAEREQRVAAAQRTLSRLHPTYAELIRDCIRTDPFHATRRALDVARIRTDPRDRCLVAGAPPPAADQDDRLWIVLVPDIGPYHGSLRLVPRDFGPAPNLPRLTPTMTVEEIAGLLADLAIRHVVLGPDVDGSAPILRRLCEAARAVGAALT